MSDHIPFEIQSEIMKRLPVKSLIQFRSVSKQWKSLIDSPKLIKSYHVNHTNPQHHLLVSYMLDDNVTTYTSIVDNNNFPQQKFSLTAPESLSLLRDTRTLSSVNRLLCFYGFYGDVGLETRMAVIWNPSVRKSVGIVIPLAEAEDIVCFGVCPDTSHPKLVKINTYVKPGMWGMWEVEVFTLSTRVWKHAYTSAPSKSCHLLHGQVFVDGVIYLCAYHFDRGSSLNMLISFDLKSEKFAEVCLPERLVHSPYLDVAKVSDSLGLLEYYDEGDQVWVCGVWMRKDGANELFTKIYTVKVEGKWLYGRVLGFRNNGEVVMEMDDDNIKESRIEVYEPLSKHITGVGINGKRGLFSARSYMETLLLLDDSHSIFINNDDSVILQHGDQAVGITSIFITELKNVV